ncbi:MAG: bifunctional phosphopantothenoylcysteine decarboxylase/phosphopantothenate--cysteine ligase CoaBC [Thermoplasmata archaeon]|nr:MAG: bifunctional phosphopantothenoylcysteine decarboxylase/phosphopantothenate--cysteine ligase CoaBC [Thermoplasmata archaeon]
MHPADEIRHIKSKKLHKKRIVLGVTGSIAAVETIHLARELIRHGAEVYPVMTKSATHIIHPYSLEFATGNKTITELTGKTEHIYFCGKTKKPADLLLIAPCTANTISKIAHGIDDTPVTTFATTAIGSQIPIIIVPAMHISMYNHKTLQENISRCKKMGISFIEPHITKNKAKIADIEEIVEHVIRKTGKQDYKNKKILIIGGATAEPIDDIRILTNRSSGKTSIALAKKAFERGAEVELWYGHGKEKTPKYITVKNFETTNDLNKLIKKTNKKHDYIILCAAIADYMPKKQDGKIPSGKKRLTIQLLPTPKILQQLKTHATNKKTTIVAFKAEEKKHLLKEKAYNLLQKNQIDYVVGNTLSAFGSDKTEILIVDKKGKTIYKKGKKEEIADHILDTIK